MNQIKFMYCSISFLLSLVQGEVWEDCILIRLSKLLDLWLIVIALHASLLTAQMLNTWGLRPLHLVSS